MEKDANEHARQIESHRWPGVKELSQKWGISRALVRAIPRDELPYLTFGESDVRRYDPADVAEYERSHKRGQAA